MYAYIRGTLAETEADAVVVETGGVGYRIFIPGQSFSELPPVGGSVKLYTYLHIREDVMILYGFLDKDDLALFRLLISVSGIGPKGGLAVLSALSADDLRFAVLAGDAKTIARAPGIGTKTAQRVILELKDKLTLTEAFEKKTEHVQTAGNDRFRDEAVQALVALGYSSAESLRAVSAVEDPGDMDTEALLRAALKNISTL